MLETINSYYFPDYSKQNFGIENEIKNVEILKCNNYQMLKYIDNIKNNKNSIKNRCHKSIDNYLKLNKSIFNRKFKFSNLSITKNQKIYMGVRPYYSHNEIIIELYLLNNLPHIMYNGEVYFENSSLIKKCKKNFNIESYNLTGIFNQEINKMLYDLFDLTFDDIFI